MAYLDKTGLTELWKKVKSYVDANGGDPHTSGQTWELSAAEAA